ncbi:hypothetical protein Esti_005470 [Eimeria stiedai]
MSRRKELGPGAHDDSMLMIPPPGFKFIPRYETVCGKSGCFECFDIYCERCESKDRRIIELEMRNNDLAKYITQLQAKVFGPPKQHPGGLLPPQAATMPFQQPHNMQPQQPSQQQQAPEGLRAAAGVPSAPAGLGYGQQPVGQAEPFAYIQSPVLFDPTLNLSYVATTSFSPANP